MEFGTGWKAIMCTKLGMTDFSGTGSILPDEEKGDYYYENQIKDCQDTFGTTPDFDFALREYGGFVQEDYKDYTNILWINGDLDPWITGSVTKTFNPEQTALFIKNGAHHTE